MIPQLTVQQLCERMPRFETYYIDTPPLIHPSQRELEGPVWWTYLQMREEGPWRRAGVRKWRHGMDLIAAHDPYDWAITSKRRGYPVPTFTKINPRTKIPFKEVGPDGKSSVDKLFKLRMPPGHTWCIWCRRPVVMRWFTRHHSFIRAVAYDPTRRRCTICGAAEQNRS